MKKGCEFCIVEKDLLSCYIESLDNLFLFGLKNDDTIEVSKIRKALGSEEVRVFFDRGYLRLTMGEDIGCLDHSLDYIKIKYCPNCGREL